MVEATSLCPTNSSIVNSSPSSPSKDWDAYHAHKKVRVYKNTDYGDIVGHTSFRSGNLNEIPARACVRVGYKPKEVKTPKFQKKFGYQPCCSEPRPQGIKRINNTLLESPTVRTITPSADTTIVTPRISLKKVGPLDNKDHFIYDPLDSNKYLSFKPGRKLDSQKFAVSPGRDIDPVFAVNTYNQCTTAASIPQICPTPRPIKANMSRVSYNIIQHVY